MKDITTILMERDNLTEEQAAEEINIAKEIMYSALKNDNYDEAYYACEVLGLEPDYLEELMYC